MPLAIEPSSARRLARVWGGHGAGSWVYKNTLSAVAGTPTNLRRWTVITSSRPRAACLLANAQDCKCGGAQRRNISLASQCARPQPHRRVVVAAMVRVFGRIHHMCPHVVGGHLGFTLPLGDTNPAPCVLQKGTTLQCFSCRNPSLSTGKT